MIVFTNGCFDVICYHHVEFLRRCRLLGDKLIVGLNSDASVYALKGSGHPVNCEFNRRTVLESLRWVDEVYIVINELHLDKLVKRIRPDVMVKGMDYSGKPITGSRWARKVLLLPLVTGDSTTKVLERIRCSTTT